MLSHLACLSPGLRQREITVRVHGLQCHHSYPLLLSIVRQSADREIRTEALMLKETAASPEEIHIKK